MCVSNLSDNNYFGWQCLSLWLGIATMTYNHRSSTLLILSVLLNIHTHEKVVIGQQKGVNRNLTLTVRGSALVIRISDSYD